MSSNHQPPPGINPTIVASTYTPMPLSVVYSVDYYAWLMHTQKEHTALQEKYDLLAAENSSVKREVEELQNRCRKLKQKKRKRRATRQLDKNFECPYEACGLRYASELALNLHIKNKHDGGTKTQRDALARLILEARSKGIQMLPETTLNLPPNYFKELISDVPKVEDSPPKLDQ